MRYPQAQTPLQAWHALASRSDWKTPSDIKAAYSSASFLANNRVVFNIQGNDYRLVVAVHYNRGLMFVRFVGTHRQYDAIDASTI
jgi:mRNA interferase HigB